MKRTIIVIVFMFILISAYICEAQMVGVGSVPERQYIVHEIIAKDTHDINLYESSDIETVTEEDIGDKPDTGDTPEDEDETEAEKE